MQRLGNDILNFNRVISDEEIIEQIKNVTKKDLIKQRQIDKLNGPQIEGPFTVLTMFRHWEDNSI